MRPTKFFTAAILLLCLTANSWGAAITTTASGLWTAGGTWVGGVAPGDGDTAVIAHDVTIADGTFITVGTSGATGTTAITINDGKKLIVGQGGAGASLICRGDIVMTQTSTTRVSGFYALEIAANSLLKWDASQATTPLSQTYVCRPSGNNQPNSRVKFSGTAAKRVTVTSDAAGGNGRFSLGGFNTRLGSVTGTYVDFSRIGDASNRAFDLYLSAATVEADTFSLSNYTMDACGEIATTLAIAADAVFSLVDGVHTNSASTQIGRVWMSSAKTTGTRLVQRVTCDVCWGNTSSAPQQRDCSFIDCCFDGSWSITVTSTTIPAQITRCFVRKTATGTSNHQISGAMVMAGTITDCIFLTDSTASNNYKWFSDCVDGPFTMTGCVWQSEGSDGTGDFMSVVNAHTVSTAITANNNLCLHNQSGTATERPGTLVTLASANANPVITCNHNTWIAGGEAAFVWGESAKPVAGVWASLKSNLVYAPLSPQGTLQYLIHDYAFSSATTDVCTAANANYNGTYGVKSGSASKGYNATFTGSPGANDASATNPNFVDTTRNLAKWAQSRGSAATTAAARALIKADPTLGDVARQWIRDGWRPTNRSFRNAGHDGVTIGALEGVFTNAQGPRNRMKTNGGLRRPARDLLHRGACVDRHGVALAV